MKKSVKATVCVMAAATAITAIPMVSAQAADEKVTVNFWHSMGGDNEKILQSVVDTYNASQDKIEVVPEYQGNYYDSIAKVQTAIGAGNGPDICRPVPDRFPFWQKRTVFWRIWFRICSSQI